MFLELEWFWHYFGVEHSESTNLFNFDSEDGFRYCYCIYVGERGWRKGIIPQLLNPMKQITLNFEEGCFNVLILRYMFDSKQSFESSLEWLLHCSMTYCIIKKEYITEYNWVQQFSSLIKIGLYVWVTVLILTHDMLSQLFFE